MSTALVDNTGFYTELYQPNAYSTSTIAVYSAMPVAQIKSSATHMTWPVASFLQQANIGYDPVTVGGTPSTYGPILTQPGTYTAELSVMTPGVDSNTAPGNLIPFVDVCVTSTGAAVNRYIGPSTPLMMAYDADGTPIVYAQTVSMHVITMFRIRPPPGGYTVTCGVMSAGAGVITLTDSGVISMKVSMGRTLGLFSQ